MHHSDGSEIFHLAILLIITVVQPRCSADRSQDSV